MQSTYATQSQAAGNGVKQQFSVPITYQDNREHDAAYLQRVQRFLDEQTMDGQQVLSVLEAQFLADLEFGETHYPVPDPSYQNTAPLGNQELEQYIVQLAQSDYSAEDVTDLYVTFARKAMEKDGFVPREYGPWDLQYLELAEKHGADDVVENYLEFSEHEQYREQEDTMPVVSDNVLSDPNQISVPIDDTFIFYRFK